jgi:hypothetical protein
MRAISVMAQPRVAIRRSLDHLVGAPRPKCGAVSSQTNAESISAFVMLSSVRWGPGRAFLKPCTVAVRNFERLADSLARNTKRHPGQRRAYSRPGCRSHVELIGKLDAIRLRAPFLNKFSPDQDFWRMVKSPGASVRSGAVIRPRPTDNAQNSQAHLKPRTQQVSRSSLSRPFLMQQFTRG